jgi:hypothetical protein
MHSVRPALVACSVVASLGLAGAARADDTHERIVDRMHTVAALELGVLALPTAPISASQRGGDIPFLGTIGRGDATIQTGIHLLFRFGRSWAIGAGFLFAPRPTSDTEYGGLSGLPRTHQRSYLFVGIEARYVPLHSKYFEGWVGLSGGGIIVADRFFTDVPANIPVLGGKGVTMQSEGVSVGIQIGADWLITERLVVGLAVRLNRWILPNEPSCSAIGDCTTLHGTTEAFETGLTVGYRIPL